MDNTATDRTADKALPLDARTKPTEKPRIRRHFLSAALVLLTLAGARAEGRHAREVYEAYVANDMDRWDAVIDTMERECPASKEELIELIGYYYGRTGYRIGSGRKREARASIAKAEAYIEQVLADAPSCAAALAYKGSFIGYRLALSRIKAPVLGPRSIRYIREAYASDSTDVQALSVMGHMLYYAPRMLGGDKRAGMAYLERAVRRAEELGLDHGDWHYLNMLVMLARYRSETGNPQAAVHLYEKILIAEPRFRRVREELYPAALAALHASGNGRDGV